MASVSVSSNDLSVVITAKIDRDLDLDDPRSEVNAAIHDIVVAYAEEWVIDNLDQIYRQLDVQAISNLVMVEVAKQVKDNIVKEKK